jgi:multidrug efflux pump subunit AcrA (membrane-fusion protein)
MLCRVEFLATPAAAPGLAARGGRATPLTLFVPETALVGDGSAVWVCDPDSRRVSQRAVTTGTTRRDGHRHVSDGLLPGEWVVVNPADLADGQRVNPKLPESL